jgi:hypothetical protein
MYLPPATLAWVEVDGDALVFEGDFKQTGYPRRVRLAPVSANDARAIFVLLDERFQIPRTPRPIVAADVAALTGPTYVQIDGTFRPGHFEASNFDGGLMVSPHDGLEVGARYRVTGFAYPAYRGDYPPVGYSGARLFPLATQRL